MWRVSMCWESTSTAVFGCVVRIVAAARVPSSS